MSGGVTATNWYYAKERAREQLGVPGPMKVGPLTWEQLWSHARMGVLGPNDLVWNPQYADWQPARLIPGLFPEMAAAGLGWSAGVMTATPSAAAPPAASRPARGRPHPALVIALVAVVVIVAGGLGAYFGFLRNRGESTAGTGSTSVAMTAVGGTSTSVPGGTTTSSTASETENLGTADVKLPDEAKLVQTKDWGIVPANQIGVVMAAGKTRADADSLASQLGGTVVGEVDYINLYQIETTAASTEDDLHALLDKAVAMPGVETAFPNIRALPHTEVWGVPTLAAVSDPIYSGNRGAGLALIGADLAWMYVKVSGIDLSDVQVGIIDSGLYTGNDEYDGDTKVTFPENGKPLSQPAMLEDPSTKQKVPDPAGSHGTMVTNMIAADPKNGGVSGIASTALGSNLKVSFIDHSSGRFGQFGRVQNPDPNNPTIMTDQTGVSYAVGNLVAIVAEIRQMKGKGVINCSWGAAAPDAATAAVYKKFFTQMANDYPDVLFVCSAGNEGKTVDGSKWWPGGLKLPNMITVGNLMNDGTAADSSTRANNTPGQEYEVTLAAPGEQAIQGVGSDGKAIDDTSNLGLGATKVRPGGTSLAAPQVTSAAAVLLALDPTLKAKDIKDILTGTAGSGPADLGGKTLAIDKAVLAVINRVRARNHLGTVTAEQLVDQFKKTAVVDAVATGDPSTGVWTVSANLPGPPLSPKGTALAITSGDGVTIPNDDPQTVTSATPVSWQNVLVAEDQTCTITVARDDSGAASVITLPPDVNGDWEGTVTITKIDLQTTEAEVSVESLGCDPNGVDWEQFVQWLANTPLPTKMQIKMAQNGVGSAVMTVDASPLKAKAAKRGAEIEQVSSTPVKFKMVYKNYKAYFATEPGQDVGQVSMTVPIARPKTGMVIEGKMIMDTQGAHLEADVKLKKKE